MIFSFSCEGRWEMGDERESETRRLRFSFVSAVVLLAISQPHHPSSTNPSRLAARGKQHTSSRSRPRRVAESLMSRDNFRFVDSSLQSQLLVCMDTLNLKPYETLIPLVDYVPQPSLQPTQSSSQLESKTTRSGLMSLLTRQEKERGG